MMWLAVLVLVSGWLPAGVVIELSPKQVEVLPGEPLFLDATLRNESNEDVELPGFGLCRPFLVDENRACNWPDFVIDENLTMPDGSTPVSPGPTIMRGGESTHLEFELDEACRFREPGVYRIAIRCGSCDEIESEIVTVTVHELTRSEDRAVWEEYVIPCRSATAMTCLKKNASKILDKYPTSRYAGYVLTRELLDLQDWRVKAADPECFVRTVKKRGFRLTYSDKEETLFESIETHVNGGNVAPELTARLWGYYGEQLFVRGRTEEARDAFATAAAAGGSGTDFYQKRAARFFEALRED